ncbi:MAG: c-type cytochrome biogenesis protein CcmI [Hyphomicrobiaceae bacterium]
MVLWIFFAVMTAALLGVVLRPFFRRDEQHGRLPEAQRLSVYKAQMAEIDADVDRGTLTSDEAESVRAEVARRLLSQADTGSKRTAGKTASSPSGTNSVLMAALLLAVPAAAMLTYLSVGSPSLPSQPHAARTIQGSGGVRVAELVRRVEAQLVQRPDDGQGWEVIAPVYMRMQRFGDAAEAYRHAVRLLGETPARLIGFAEASVFSGNGVVGEDARTAFMRVRRLAPDNLSARYWLAVATEQDGDLQAARKEFAALLKRTGADNATGKVIADRLKSIDTKIRQGGTPAPGAVSSMMANPETAQMIEGMVAGLAERLESDTTDFDGWMKLIRSYAVLGRGDDAAKALTTARKTFADSPQRLEQLRQLANDLQIGT